MDPQHEEAIHNERHVKVICVGAGASGLCLAYKLQRSFRKCSLTVRSQERAKEGARMLLTHYLDVRKKFGRGRDVV